MTIAALGVVKAVPTRRASCRRRCKVEMVRNIDLPEAIIFYGLNSILDVKSNKPRSGVEALLRECQEINAAAIILLDKPMDGLVRGLMETYQLQIHVDCKHPPPNPRALWDAVQSTTIQPKGFGGSSGFGAKLPEPERNPLQKHVVVLAKTLDQCRAARFFGARVMSLEDNDLADGVVADWSEIGIDDICTPGSYWLNPPFGPKDDVGNKVDMFEVMTKCEMRESSTTTCWTSEEISFALGSNLNEEAIKLILDDLDTLYFQNCKRLTSWATRLPLDVLFCKHFAGRV
jgi:hypothetical protein